MAKDMSFLYEGTKKNNFYKLLSKFSRKIDKKDKSHSTKDDIISASRLNKEIDQAWEEAYEEVNKTKVAKRNTPWLYAVNEAFRNLVGVRVASMVFGDYVYTDRMAKENKRANDYAEFCTQLTNKAIKKMTDKYDLDDKILNSLIQDRTTEIDFAKTYYKTLSWKKSEQLAAVSSVVAGFGISTLLTGGMSLASASAVLIGGAACSAVRYSMNDTRVKLTKLCNLSQMISRKKKNNIDFVKNYEKKTNQDINTATSRENYFEDRLKKHQQKINLGIAGSALLFSTIAVACNGGLSALQIGDLAGVSTFLGSVASSMVSIHGIGAFAKVALDKKANREVLKSCLDRVKNNMKNKFRNSREKTLEEQKKQSNPLVQQAYNEIINNYKNNEESKKAKNIVNLVTLKDKDNSLYKQIMMSIFEKDENIHKEVLADVQQKIKENLIESSNNYNEKENKLKQKIFDAYIKSGTEKEKQNVADELILLNSTKNPEDEKMFNKILHEISGNDKFKDLVNRVTIKDTALNEENVKTWTKVMAKSISREELNEEQLQTFLLKMHGSQKLDEGISLLCDSGSYKNMFLLGQVVEKLKQSNDPISIGVAHEISETLKEKSSNRNKTTKERSVRKFNKQSKSKDI